MEIGGHKRRHARGALAALGLVAVSAAFAGEGGGSEGKFFSILFTPPLLGPFFQCLVTNVGPTPVVVQPQVFDSLGADISDPPPPEEEGFCTREPLEPLNSCNTFGSPGNSSLAHCRIIVFGRKSNVRASLQTDDSSVSAE